MGKLKKKLLRKISSIILLVIILPGCGTSIVGVPVVPVDFQRIDKIPISVELLLTENLQIAELFVQIDGSYRVPLGNAFSENAELLARSIFKNVSVRSEEMPSSGQQIDAVLVPEMISATQTRPLIGSKDAVLLIVFQWTLNDRNRNPIWVDTIKAKGISRLVVGLNVKNGTKVRVEKVITDLFTKSFEAMSSSREIRKFASTNSAEDVL